MAIRIWSKSLKPLNNNIIGKLQIFYPFFNLTLKGLWADLKQKIIVHRGLKPLLSLKFYLLLYNNRIFILFSSMFLIQLLLLLSIRVSDLFLKWLNYIFIE